MKREQLRKRLRTSVPIAFASAFAYALATTLLVAGPWWPEFLIIAIVAYLFSCAFEQSWPRLLVLRRFGVPDVETFLRLAVGGLSFYARPIWLSDARSSYAFRRSLSSLWLYASRIIIWATLSVTVIVQVRDDLSAKLAWIGWMILGTSVYDRHVAGRRPIVWLSCVGAAISTKIALGAGKLPGPEPMHFLGVAGLFFTVWALLTALGGAAPMQRFCGLMQRRRLISTFADLARFQEELSGTRLLRRFVPNAPVQVVEVECTEGMWASAVYDALGCSSVVVADVSNIRETTGLAWEIEQAVRAGVPLLLTCEADAVSEARDYFAGARGVPPPIFAWRRQRDGRLGVRFDESEFARRFFELIETHLESDLSYLPTRPTREQALSALADSPSQDALPG